MENRALSSDSILICGGGASGLIGAILLARGGKRVLILEKNRALAKKILVSGNGRCNISNTKVSPSRYYSKSSNLIKSFLSPHTTKDVIEFFRSVGLEIVEGDSNDGRLFPASFSAKSVIDLLEWELERLGVEVEFECEVKSIKKLSKGYLIKSSKGDFSAKVVILAMGSPAYPKLGASMGGLDIAKTLKHNIISSLPSLVPIESSSRWIKSLAGLKIDAEVTFFRGAKREIKRRGDLLFTKYGLSGLVILDISPYLSLAIQRGQRVSLRVDISPDFRVDELKSFLKQRVKKERDLPLNLWLEGIVHKNLAKALIKKMRLDGLSERSLSDKVISKIAFGLKNIEIDVTKTRGFEWAEVALGGVDLRGIEPKTLESKLQKGLYITGELLDITGDRGGFNLHFAWICGFKVAKAILKESRWRD